MKSRTCLKYFGVSVLLLILTACSSDSDNPKVVIDWHGILGEGYSRSWSLDSGTYRLEMTSTPNGASVEWLPSSGCQNVHEAKEYYWDCRLTMNGQLKITNPTTLGLGPSESVTVRVTKL